VIAVVSVPWSLAGVVGEQLTQGRAVPTKQAEQIGRVYMLVPLLCLAGTGLFDRPEIEIQYFKTEAEAQAWGEADIVRREEGQRLYIRSLLVEGVRGRQELEER
jgi:hypothetical protein